MEHINNFLEWWHSIFGSWNPNMLPSLSFWYLDDEMTQQIPMISSWLMLAVVICSILSLITSVFYYKGGNLLFKFFTIPLCFLGLITWRLADEMSYTLFHTLTIFVNIFVEQIPGLFSQPDIGSLLLELLDVVLAIPLSLFSIALHGGLTILGLAPFLAVIVMDVFLYGWMAPIQIFADIGGGIILVLALILAVLGVGMVTAPMLLVAMFPFLSQAIREWNFIGNGGTIIRE